MEIRKKAYIKTFTVLGAAMVFLTLGNMVGNLAYALTAQFIITQEAGAFRWLSWLFTSRWTDLLVQYVFVLGIPSGIAWLIMSRLPKLETVKYPLPMEEFLILLIMASGIGYLLNFGGNFINSFVASFTGKTLEEMNPVISMSEDLSPAMIVYACLLGPFMEEVLYRGWILKRARVFGDKTAVIYSALLFGLMHGNLSQFLYAVFVGIIFGYVAVKTGGIRWSVLMHILFNSYSTVLLLGLNLWTAAKSPLFEGLYSFAMLAAIFLFIALGLFFFRVHWKRIWWELTVADGSWAPYRRFAYLNPGFLLYVFLCIPQFLLYLF